MSGEVRTALRRLETWQQEDSECRVVEIKIVEGGYTVDLWQPVDYPVEGLDMSHTATIRSAEGETLPETVNILFPWGQP